MEDRWLDFGDDDSSLSAAAGDEAATSSSAAAAASGSSAAAAASEGSRVRGVPEGDDGQSHDLSRSSPVTTVDGQAHDRRSQSILCTYMPQREWLGTTHTLSNASTVANIPKLRDELRRHLEEAPCLVIHCGTYQTDFESLIAFATALSDSHRPATAAATAAATASGSSQLPVAFCATEAKGRYVIGVDSIATALLRGCSVFYHLITAAHAQSLASQLSLCAALAREQKVDISPIRLIIIIDRTATYVISRAIREESEDRAFLADPDSEMHRNRTSVSLAAGSGGSGGSGGRAVGERMSLVTQYLPQVEPIQTFEPTMMSKEWEARMTVHAFRNSHSPPTTIRDTRFPLDLLGFFLAYHPFGQSFVLAAALLPEKGPMVRKLLESWVNSILGTPTRFFVAD